MQIANRREIAAHRAANRAPRASYIVGLLLLSLSLTIVRIDYRSRIASRVAESIRVFSAVPRNTGDEAFKSNISLVSLRLGSPRLASPREIDGGESRPGAARL